MKTGDHIKIAAGLGIAMFLALLPLPYGFYTLLRIATFVGGIYFAIQLWERERVLAYGLAFAGLLFNPIWPIHLDRNVWAIFNAAGACLFGAVAWKFYSTAEPAPDAENEADGEP